MRRYLTVTIGLALLIGPIAAGWAQEQIPAHPKDLVYPPLDYQVPPPDQFREVLSNGMVVYIAEDRMLPIFDLSIIIRTGGALDPAGKEGLAALAGEELREGGTKNLGPEELDERIDFLAASIRTSISDTRGGAGISLLSKDIDEGLALFMDVLRYPRFDEERLRKAKDRRLQYIKRRNDRTSTIEQIEWGFLMDGPEHFSNRYPSSASVKSITRDDLLAFHRRYIHPGNMMLAVTGDFDRADMLAKLEKAFGDWPTGEPGPTTFAKPEQQPTPGTYLVHKESADGNPINQGRVSIGHKTIMRGSPDEFALRVMNGILGGTGFKSRLTAKVRSHEGLAYSVGSSFEQGVYYPGDLRCFLQTKSSSCSYAIGLVIDEIRRLQSEMVPQQEVDETIAYYVESFPQAFQSKMALLQTYLSDEYTGRDPRYWLSYVDNIKKVTPEDVQRVARQYLHPDELVILAVGDGDAIMAGGCEQAPDLTLDKFGTVQRLPVRDPDTLER